MTKRDDKITLTEIAQNIRLARSFMAGLDQVAFAVDSKTIYAVVRALEIISEGTRRRPDDACFTVWHPIRNGLLLHGTMGKV